MPKSTAALGIFEGREILGRAVKITNTGDGLSKSMKVEPRNLQIGDTVYFQGRGVVVSAEHDPIKDTEGLLRIDVIRAGTIAFIEESVAREALDKQEALIDEALGRVKLPFEPAPDPAAAPAAKRGARPYGDELQTAHDNGDHARALVEGCPSCDAEAAAKAAEDAAAKPARRTRKASGKTEAAPTKAPARKARALKSV